MVTCPAFLSFFLFSIPLFSLLSFSFLSHVISATTSILLLRTIHPLRLHIFCLFPLPFWFIFAFSCWSFLLTFSNQTNPSLSQVKEQNPEISFTDIARELGNRWKAMGESSHDICWITSIEQFLVASIQWYLPISDLHLHSPNILHFIGLYLPLTQLLILFSINLFLLSRRRSSEVTFRRKSKSGQRKVQPKFAPEHIKRCFLMYLPMHVCANLTSFLCTLMNEMKWNDSSVLIRVSYPTHVHRVFVYRKLEEKTAPYLYFLHFTYFPLLSTFSVLRFLREMEAYKKKQSGAGASVEEEDEGGDDIEEEDWIRKYHLICWYPI